LIHAISPLDESALQQGLRQLVEAELIYQRGLSPQATYFFAVTHLTKGLELLKTLPDTPERA
jgi:hypothetical protein